MTMDGAKADDEFRLEFDVDPDRRSGLAMLRAVARAGIVQSREEKDIAFLTKIRATDETWREWCGVKSLRVIEGLALHHHWDPRALGLTDRTNKRFLALCEEYGQVPNGVLALFGWQLAWLEEYIRNGRLQVKKRRDPLCQSVVRVETFTQFMARQPVMADFCSLGNGPESDAEARIPLKFSSPLAQAVYAASCLYQTVAEGGSYVPGDLRTVPDVDGFLRKHFPWISPTKRRQICEIVRPPELPMGRPKR